MVEVVVVIIIVEVVVVIREVVIMLITKMSVKFRISTKIKIKILI